MHFFVPDNGDMYSIIESTRYNISPLRFGLLQMQNLLTSSCNPFVKSNLGNVLRANIEIAERITRVYRKPKFGINSVVIDKKEYKIEQITVRKDIFCELQYFQKLDYNKEQPKLLIVAPMAGHHATLLRSTVQDMLPHFEIYVTDWINANQVPIADGSFDLDSFIDYMINYIKFLGSNVHVMAVCQPTVPVLAATALMSADQEKNLPKSLILIGGPIDARKNPTVPNEFAIHKTLEWFDQVMISTVPNNYPGFRRRVYPGFIQLAGFMSMNMQRHITSHIDLYKSLLVEDTEKAAKQRNFYDEYLSVMDLTAEFYLQTIKEVFQDFALAKGKFFFRGRKVELDSISKCAIMGIEGELDDIAAVGQTKAALGLCKNVPEKKKKYYLQKGSGHYGVFSGSKFRQFIVPEIQKFVAANN